MSGVSAPPLSTQDRAEITSLDALGVGATGQFIAKTGPDAYGYATAVVSMNGLGGAAQTIAMATGGTAPSVSSAGTVHTFTVPQIVTLTPTLGALDVSKTVFVADTTYQIVSVQLSWGVAGGAGAVLNVEKLTGTTAPGSGTTVQTGTVDLTATANTVTTPALTGTVSTLQLAAGDRIGVKLGGVLTGLVGCTLTIILKRI